MAPSLKSDFNVWLVGSCQPENVREDSHYKDQLPTKGQVLRHLFFLKKTTLKGRPLQDVVAEVCGKVMDIWYLAKIPSLGEKQVKRNLEKMFNNWRLLQKNMKKVTEKEVKNRGDFSDQMDCIFDIACPDWEKRIKQDRLKDDDEKEEDLTFLQDQRSDRRLFLGEFSAHYGEAFVDKMSRLASSENQEQAEEDRQDQVRKDHKKRKEEAMIDIDDNNNKDSEFQVNVKKAKRSDTVILEMPRKILAAPGICQMLDRTKQSTRAAVGNIATIIKAAGGDLDEFDLSATTVWNTRNAKRKEELEKFYSNFQPPKHSVVGWDGKVVKEVMGSVGSVEYLAVVLSGAPNMVEGKMLEVEEISDGTGKTQCDTTLAVLKACKATDSVRALVFDTTASNSGVRKGAASRLMQELDRPLMWFECRHHMAELFIKPTWILLFGVDNSPEWSDFGLFQKMAPYIRKEEMILLTVSPGLEQDLKEKSVELLTKLLKEPNKKKQFPTDSYRQMVELTLAVLGAEVPGGFKFRKPGAFHKARFMANVIYGSQMFLLQHLTMDEEKMELDNVTMEIEFDDEYKASLSRFVKFSSLVYVPYFMLSSIGADAPFNDLELFKLLNKYKGIDSEVAEIAIAAMKRHLFYLTQENVVLVLFSNRLDDDQKSRIASRMLTYPKPDKFKAEKPKPPAQIDQTTSLESLVGERSWTLFHVLNIQTSWLEEDPSRWSEDDNFCEARDWVRTAKVVNDSCERAIKMIQDFCNTMTSDSFLRRGLLKAVDSCREQFPDFKKKTLNKNFV